MEQFLWGAATADFQYEGGLKTGDRGILAMDYLTDGTNDQARRITYRDEKGEKRTCGFYESLPRNAKPYFDEAEYYHSHNATDFNGHWEEDIENMKELGLKAYRFSICWTRIFPTGVETEPREAGLLFYDRVIDKLREAGIEPVVTICHDEIPAFLADEYDGWLDRRVIDCYLRLAEVLLRRYAGKVKYWITFNEINAVNGYTELGFHEVNLQNRLQAIHHCFVATAKTVELARRIDPAAKIGTMFSASAVYPATCRPEDAFYTLQFRQEKLYYYLDVLTSKGYQNYVRDIWARNGISVKTEAEDAELFRQYPIDYLAISYYRSMTEGPDVADATKNLVLAGGGNPYLKKTQWGYPIDPQGLRYVLNELYMHAQRPIIVVENGLGNLDTIAEDGGIHDDYRIEYLRLHVQELMKAVEIDRVPCFGYCVWAMTDLVSLSTGEMKKRYGLVHVELDDKGRGSGKRRKKDSYYWYQNVIKTNGQER